MKFFEIDSTNKEIKIYTQILKEHFANIGKGISDILFINTIVFNLMFNEVIITFCNPYGGKATISNEQWVLIEDKLYELYLNSQVFSYSINTTKNSIELVFDAEIGMISEH